MTYMIDSIFMVLPIVLTSVYTEPRSVWGTTVNQPSIKEILGVVGPKCKASANKDFFCVHDEYWWLVGENARRKAIIKEQIRMGVIK